MGIFFTIFFQPILNLMFIFMNFVSTNSLVFGILAIVIFVKIILLPLSIKNTEMQAKLGKISDEIKKIKENIKDKKQQAEKMLKLYKKEGVNPFSPIFSLIIQIPIFLAIFFVTRDLGNNTIVFEEALYNFVNKPEILDGTFFFVDLFQNGPLWIAILVMATQFVLIKQTQKHSKTAVTGLQKNILIILPIMAGVVTLFFVATVAIYWLFNNLVSILQEMLVLEKIKNKN